VSDKINTVNNRVLLLNVSILSKCFQTVFCCFVVMLWLVGCSTMPEIKPVIVQKPDSLIDYALSLQGAPYRYGKETPEEGFDCSGFVRHVYGRQGVRLPRTVKEMAAVLPTISKDNLRSGDLVFFNTDSSNYFSHVGILVERDKFIHAASSRTGKVLVSSMKNDYWRKRFVGVRRPRL
jgi:cell wall-associated NlpC family hydrolase